MHNPFTGWTVWAPRRAFHLTLAACLALAGAGAADSTLARHRQRSEAAKEKAAEPARPSGPLFFVISTNAQHVSVYGPDGLYARSPVSTGQPGHSTPHGIFSIIGKERFHRSNLYSGAPMPFMQRVTWSGVAMHEGVLPGYPASHGCIRMPHEFARRLFGITAGNERVIITRQDIVPAQFSHPRLPVPKLMPAPASGNIASAHMLQNAIASANLSSHPGGAEKVDASVNPAAPAEAGQPLLNPLDYAKQMKAAAAKQAVDAEAALAKGRRAIEAKSREAREASAAFRRADNALDAAKDRLEAAQRQLARANERSGEVSKATAEAKARAEAKLTEAQAALAAAARAMAETEQEAAAATKAATGAKAGADAKEAEAEAARAKAEKEQKAAYALKAAIEANASAEVKPAEAGAAQDAAPEKAKNEQEAADALKAAAEAKAMQEAKLAEAEAAQAAARETADKEEEAAGASKTAAKAKARAEVKLAEAEASLANAVRVKAEKEQAAAEAITAATGAKAAAETKVAEAQTALAAAERAMAEKEQESATALKAYRDTEAARKAALTAIKTWTRRLSPLSIFVSRKTQRLYIRQGHIKVFDVPVTIREPEKPLGTHLYMSMPPEPGAQGSQPALRWVVLTVPEAGTGDESEGRRRRRRHRGEVEDDAPRVAVPAASASEALDRIEVPAEAEAKIAELFWAGGSLIVSDKPMSGETGEYTDFVILTR